MASFRNSARTSSPLCSAETPLLSSVGMSTPATHSSSSSATRTKTRRTAARTASSTSAGSSFPTRSTIASAPRDRGPVDGIAQDGDRSGRHPSLQLHEAADPVRLVDNGDGHPRPGAPLHLADQRVAPRKRVDVDLDAVAVRLEARYEDLPAPTWRGACGGGG